MTWQQMFAVRFLLGLGIGPKSATVPVFCAETAPAKVSRSSARSTNPADWTWVDSWGFGHDLVCVDNSPGQLICSKLTPARTRTGRYSQLPVYF